MEKIIFITSEREEYRFMGNDSKTYCFEGNMIFINSNAEEWDESEETKNLLLKFIKFIAIKKNLIKDFEHKCSDNIESLNLNGFSFGGTSKLYILHHHHSEPEDALAMNEALKNWLAPLGENTQIQVSPYSIGNAGNPKFYTKSQIFNYNSTWKKEIVNAIANNIKKIPVVAEILNVEKRYHEKDYGSLAELKVNLENDEGLKMISNSKNVSYCLVKLKDLPLEDNQTTGQRDDLFSCCFLGIEFIKKSSNNKGEAFPIELEELERNTEKPKPIVFIGAMDLFNEREDGFYKKQIKEVVDPRFRFFDSSIWFRYIPFTEVESKLKDYIELFKNKQAIFKITEAKEFRDFSIRQFNESYINKKDDKTEGHAIHIAPYGFHSESKMEKWAIEEKHMINGFKWNFLIIDDGFSEDTDTNPLKRTLINDVINDYRANDDYYVKTIQNALYNKIRIKASGDVNPENSNTKGATSSVETESKRQNTFKMLLNCARSFKYRIFPKAKKIENPNSPTNSHTKYDIILLDYYFRDNSHSQAEFGEEFLIQLLQPEKADTEKEYLNDKYLGPTGKFWIFPISVYSTSLVDKLRDNRITWYDDKWIISPGADPLNTPELFRYKIYSFMRRQLEEFSIQYRDEKENSNPQKKLFPQLAFYLISFMFSMDESKQLKDNDIICKWVNRVRPSTGSDEIKNVQKYMINIFPKIVEQGVKFKRLCENKETSSLAGTVIEKFYFNFKKYDWDHFQNLIYLVAYGNRSNLDQVWNELNYIESRYNEIIQEKNKDKNHNYDEVLKFFIAVVKAYLE